MIVDRVQQATLWRTMTRDGAVTCARGVRA